MRPSKRAVDPKQSPWMSWEEEQRTVTVCQYCSRRYDINAIYEADNHEVWCAWQKAYEQLCDSNYFEKD